jgi:hypothetical protein
VDLRALSATTVLGVVVGVAGCGSPQSASIYIKASNPAADARFGGAVAVSADGSTLAVGASGESSSATGIDGDQTDRSAAEAGAVYVFTRVGGTWSQAAYIKASNTYWGDTFGTSVALSADGSTLVVGAPQERSCAIGIDGDQADRTAPGAGAAYVFSRADGRWSQQAYVKASNTQTYDDFGRSVALSADGDTLAVGAAAEDSGAAGIDGDQDDESVFDAGAVYVFSRAGGKWSQETYVKASNPGQSYDFGTVVALSADGATLAVGAIGEQSLATGIDGQQADDGAIGAGAVYVYARAGGTWSQQAYVKPSNTDVGYRFGSSMGLSSDGSTMAVGAPGEPSSAAGVDGNQADVQDPGAGAAYVFSRAGGRWSQEAYLKASNTGESDGFAWTVALSADGATLAVGAPFEDSGATGVNGDQADDSVTDAGAGYRFVRAGGTWSQVAYLKASNSRAAFDSMCLRPQKQYGFPCSGPLAGFGMSVALSGDASTLAAGAVGDVSGAPGVNGDQWDTSAQGAGAVYVF